MKLSAFGEKYGARSGILDLMDDLGNALSLNPDMISLGGGNPGRIPAVEDWCRATLREIADDPERVHTLLGRYQAPQGEESLLKRMAELLRREYGWPVTWRNIAVSNGGQSAFHILANMLAGTYPDGSVRPLLMPLAPEYLGYADAGLSQGFFRAAKPSIELLQDHLFKYRVDFDRLPLDEHVAGLCVSRPTNPTGNVLSDAELRQLDALARGRGIPFIIDGAYGTPFPNIIFEPVEPFWNDNTVLLLSLSKLGLPGVRTGFVIASETLIRAFTGANTIINLACGNLGPMLAESLLRDERLLTLSREAVMPWYRERARRALDAFREALADLPFHIHKPEGALFLWLWFPGLPGGCQALYERLKARGVLVIAGHHCFPGLEEDWAHARECIRVSYAKEAGELQRGIRLIAEEVRRTYSQGE